MKRGIVASIFRHHAGAVQRESGMAAHMNSLCSLEQLHSYEVMGDKQANVLAVGRENFSVPEESDEAVLYQVKTTFRWGPAKALKAVHSTQELV